MPTTYIPEEDRLVRYVKPLLVARDPETKAVLGVFPQAFALREGEAALSAAWAEYYSGQRAEQIQAAIAIFKETMTVKRTAVFAVGQVGSIKGACEQFGVSVRVVLDPDMDTTPPHEAHVSILRYRDDDLGLLELLASDVWNDLHQP